jgi:hypothetical protein
MATKTASGVSIDFGINPDAAMILASRIASSIPLGVIPKDRCCTVGKFASIIQSPLCFDEVVKMQNSDGFVKSSQARRTNPEE